MWYVRLRTCKQVGQIRTYVYIFSNYDSLSDRLIVCSIRWRRAIVERWERRTMPSCFLDKGAPLMLPRAPCVGRLPTNHRDMTDPTLRTYVHMHTCMYVCMYVAIHASYCYAGWYCMLVAMQLRTYVDR